MEDIQIEAMKDYHPEEENLKKFMGMRLNPQITPFNVISFYAMQFGTFLINNFIISFYSYLLRENYAVAPTAIGDTLGSLGFYSGIPNLIFDPSMGAAMDVIGRKKPCVIGLLFCSGCLYGMPWV